MMPAVGAHAAPWVGLTLAVFFAIRALQRRLGWALLHPVLLAGPLLALLVAASGQPVADYQAGTAPLSWLLGPTVVAMAVPIWQRRALIRANWASLLVAVLGTMTASAGTMLLLCPILGETMGRALSLRGVTVAVALAVAQPAHLSLPLVTLAVMLSGLFGMVLGPWVLARCGLSGDLPATGAALGCGAHGLGTARAFEIGPTAGAFASVCMGLTTLAYGLIMPLVLAAL